MNFLRKLREKELRRPARTRYFTAPNETALRTVTLTTSAPEAPKEVASVITNKIPTTESIPSSFGMPVYGRAFGMAAGAVACAQTTTVVLGAHTGAMGRIKGAFPWTSAWRPPSC